MPFSLAKELAERRTRLEEEKKVLNARLLALEIELQELSTGITKLAS